MQIQRWSRVNSEGTLCSRNIFVATEMYDSFSMAKLLLRVNPPFSWNNSVPVFHIENGTYVPEDGNWNKLFNIMKE